MQDFDIIPLSLDTEIITQVLEQFADITDHVVVGPSRSVPNLKSDVKLHLNIHLGFDLQQRRDQVA